MDFGRYLRLSFQPRREQAHHALAPGTFKQRLRIVRPGSTSKRRSNQQGGEHLSLPGHPVPILPTPTAVAPRTATPHGRKEEQ